MNNKRDIRTVCYFGISSPGFSRNRVYIEALKKRGVKVIECFDDAPGFRKLVNLFRLHWKVRESYDVLVVAYPGHAIVWFARLITKKPVIFDALSSFYESEVISRRPLEKRSLFGLKMWLIDFVASHVATRTLVESESQVSFYRKMFFVSAKKCRCVYTGAAEIFQPYAGPKKPAFTVLFRGKFLPEAGVRHVLAAARLLKGEDIRFHIMGFGLLQKEIEAEITAAGLSNVDLDTREYPTIEALRERMVGDHVSLGQLEAHERLERTIPHKAFESASLKLPFITARTKGVGELFEDGVSAYMVNPSDPKDLARVILEVKNDYAEACARAERAYETYRQKASGDAIGARLISIFEEVV